MSGFALKIFGLIFMTLDHLCIIFGDLPQLHIPGRLAAPIFAFLISEGTAHTSDRIRYMLRLYILSVLMSVFDMLTGYEITNNIMATFFLAVLNVTAAEKIGEKKYIWFAAFAAQAVSSVLNNNILNIFMPSPFTCEGGIGWVILTAALYFLRESKRLRLAAAAAFALSYFPFENPAAAFGTSYQWIMIFALPFLALYNGKRGKNTKYLFYIYYPLHLCLFYFIGKII